MCTELSTEYAMNKCEREWRRWGVAGDGGERRRGGRKWRWWWQALQIHCLQAYFAHPHHFFFQEDCTTDSHPKSSLPKTLVFYVKLFLSIPVNKTLTLQWTSSCLSFSSVTYCTFTWTLILMYVCAYGYSWIRTCVQGLHLFTNWIDSALNQYLTIN